MRAELGAALRAARARRDLGEAIGGPITLPPLAPRRTRLPLRALVVAAIAALALLVIALLPPGYIEEPGGGEPAPAGGAPAVGAPVTIPPFSRGISLTPVGVAEPSATPEPSPSPNATVTPKPRRSAKPGTGGGGGSGGGGSGGSGGGSGGGTASPAPVTQTRIVGYVVDAKTGKGIPGVCVVVGVRQCSEYPIYTDASGKFDVTLPAPNSWDFDFVKDGYVPEYRRVVGDRPLVDMGKIPLQPR